MVLHVDVHLCTVFQWFMYGDIALLKKRHGHLNLYRDTEWSGSGSMCDIYSEECSMKVDRTTHPSCSYFLDNEIALLTS